MKVPGDLRRQKGGGDFGEWDTREGGADRVMQQGRRGHTSFMILFKVLTSVISYVSETIFLVTFSLWAEGLLMPTAPWLL